MSNQKVIRGLGSAVSSALSAFEIIQDPRLIKAANLINEVVYANISGAEDAEPVVTESLKTSTASVPAVSSKQEFYVNKIKECEKQLKATADPVKQIKLKRMMATYAGHLSREQSKKGNTQDSRATKSRWRSRVGGEK
jgi:hypothetical protein